MTEINSTLRFKLKNLTYEEGYNLIAENVKKARMNHVKNQKKKQSVLFPKQELNRIIYGNNNTNNSNNPNLIGSKQIRVGGSKGKEGRADHTAGKKAFKRPCTVGWKSQNQPIKRGGGNRTPL